MNQKGKKITEISWDPHQNNKMFKESRSKRKVDSKQVIDREL